MSRRLTTIPGLCPTSYIRQYTVTVCYKWWPHTHVHIRVSCLFSQTLAKHHAHAYDTHISFWYMHRATHILFWCIHKSYTYFLWYTHQHISFDTCINTLPLLHALDTFSLIHKSTHFPLIPAHTHTYFLRYMIQCVHQDTRTYTCTPLS